MLQTKICKYLWPHSDAPGPTECFETCVRQELFCLDGSLRKALFSCESQCVCYLEGISLRMSELLTYLHLEDGAESSRWVKLCLISPKVCQQNLASKYYPDPRQASGDLLLKLQYVGFFFSFLHSGKIEACEFLFLQISHLLFLFFFPIFSSAPWFAGTCSLASPEGKTSGNGWSKRVNSGLFFFSLLLWHREGRIVPTKDSESVRV